MTEIITDIAKDNGSTKSPAMSDWRLRAALNASRMGLWDWDLQSNIVTWSAETYEIVGLEGFDGSFEAFARLLHPDDVAHAMEVVDSALKQKCDYTDEFRILRPDGEERWLFNLGRPIFDENGVPLRLSGTVQDITKRKLAEEALRESEARYRLITSSMSQGVIYQNADGTILAMNSAAERILGKPHESIIGSDSVREEKHSIREDGSPFPGVEHPALVALRTGLAVRGVIMGVWNPQRDAYRWINVDAIPIFRPAETSPAEVCAVFADITQRKQAEAALLQSEKALKEAQRVAHIGNWRWDVNSDEVWWSEELYRLFEKSPDSPSPSFKDAYKNYTPDSVARLTTVVQKAWQTGEPYVIDLERRASAGSRRWVQCRGEAVRNAGGLIVGLRGTAQDITGPKEAEESTKNYAKRLITLEEDLRKGIATELHDDVGQELTALSLNLAFIAIRLGKESEVNLRPVLEEARTLAKAINSTVRNLMNALRPTQLDEYGLVSALRTYAEQYAQRTGIAVAIQAATGFPRLGSAKELAFFRITQEALNNVAKHAEATTVTVALDSDTASTRLTITDDGKGLSPGATLLPPGSGYGLTIMRERTELVGGKFTMSSAPGSGTSVIVELGEGE